MNRFLLAGSIAALASASAHAQTATPLPDTAFEDEVVVTGSRIAVDGPAESTSPVTAIGGADISTSGVVDVSELLRETPALQASLPASFSAFNGGALGVGQLNLRGLGTERTLVLQNGRRHVAGVSGTGAVDVTTISTALLDRVDVLTGGASSIYGADAVTGVVNFIMRDGGSFDGFEVQAQAGISTRGDADEAYLSIANGVSTADGRGDIVFAAEYNTASSVRAGERDFAGSGLASLEGNNATLAAALGISEDFSNAYITDTALPISSASGIISLTGSAFVDVLLSGGTPGCDTIGEGAAATPTCQIFDNGVLRPYNPGDIFIGPFAASGGDGVRTEPDVELILPESERFILSAAANYEFAPNVNFFADAKYAYSETIESNQVNGFNDDIPISRDNPFIPAALQTQLAALDAQGVDTTLVVSRDTLDADVLPQPVAERKVLRIVTGFEGEVFDTGLNYELSFNYGRTDADITNSNTRLEDRFFAAIDAVVDPETGEIVCRSSLADFDPNTPIPVSPFPDSPGQFATFQPGDGQCSPINIFGANTITGAGAEFAFIPTTSTNELEQKVFLATLAGTSERVFELPAGPVGFAVGYEHREEDSVFISDGLVQGGLTFGSNNSGPTFPVSGNIEVDEVFGEVRVPVLADMAFAQRLEVNASYRYSDYNTIGGADAYSLGGRWELIPELTLRGTYSRAVRSPNINELFSPLQPDSIGAAADPCNPQFIEAGSEFREANCAQFVAPGFDSTTFNSAFVPGQSGGNQNLSEEIADTFTIGAVIQPDTILPGFQLIMDYYNIEIEGLIDTLAPFQIASNCVDLPSIDNQFCDAIFRDPTDGFITGFVSGEINLGSVQTEGVDFSARYRRDVPSVLGDTSAELSVGLLGTHFLSYEEAPDPADPTAIDDLQGEFTRPDWIVNFNVDYDFDRFGLGWRVRYESSQLLGAISNNDLESDPDFANITETGDSFVHDFVFSADLADNFELYGGINNAFDRNPYLGTLSRPAGPRGRYVFAGLNARF